LRSIGALLWAGVSIEDAEHRSSRSHSLRSHSVMISMPWSICPAILAVASRRVFSQLLKRNTLFALCAVLLFAIQGQAQQLLLTRHVRQVVLNGHAQLLGDLPANQIMQLDIVLPLSDQAGLDAFLSELSNPASPSYRHFLTVAEFTTRFGPSQANYDAVLAFAKASGLTVVGGTRDSMEVEVKAPVSAIETAFHVKMRSYQHPTENRTFYAPDREPGANLPFRLWHISGLDNYSIPQTRLVSKSDYAAAHGISTDAAVSHATTGSGPSASFLGSDMRAAYYGGTALTGAGQNLGLLEYAGTDLADLNTYFTNIGQTNNVPVTLLSVDGTSTSCTCSVAECTVPAASPACDDTEQTLDMTQAIGMAPGLSSLTMYIGSSDTAILGAMTTHSPLPATIGCSWGWTPADASTLDPYFQRMAAQGQNFFAASGDSSTWSSIVVAWPSDDANVVSVGGTDLVTDGAGGAWQSETAWADSGGGISPDSIAIPAWQQLPGVINSSNQGSTALRNGPDVSANANFTFYTCADQTACQANQYGGTSFAAPMWAGYIALVNQQLAANSEPTAGFLNPLIYAQNISSAYPADFHDITSGTSGSYSAVAGYDLVTGWGSPNGQNLINELGGAPAPGFALSASPSTLVFLAGGTATATITVQETGGFTGSVTLVASALPSGVTASFTPNPATGTSVLTLSASTTAATQTFSLTVTGTSGALSASTLLGNVTVMNTTQVTAPSPVNFGPENIGTTSPVVPIVFTFATVGAFSSKAVTTQGALGLDFADAGTGTCMANTAYAAGQTCTVNVTFTPRLAGTRYGAAVLKYANGNVIATAYFQGAGVGPQINFQPGVQSTVLSTGLSDPEGVAVDGSGNVYISDVLKYLVLKETPSAGSYTSSTVTSQYYYPVGLAVDGGGNLYFGTSFYYGVFEETSSAAGYSTSWIGSNIRAPWGIAVDGSGNVYMINGTANTVFIETLTASGYVESTPASITVAEPGGIAVDGSGNIYLSDASNGLVVEETPSAGGYTQSTVVGGLGQPQGLAVDGNGNVYIADYKNNQIVKMTPAASGFTQSTIANAANNGLNQPFGVAVDGGGNVYIADSGNKRVLKLDFFDPPSLSFASTPVGSISMDSPQTVTVANAGDLALSFPIPSTGNNPSITANFTLNSSGASACPLLTAGSSTPETLAPGASCQLLISFAPTAEGLLSGSLALTDNNLNAPAPGYATQSILLNGPGSFLTASPASLTVYQGASNTSTITVAAGTGSVSLAVTSAMPTGVTASFGTNPTSGTSVLTLKAATNAPSGTYNLTVTGTSGTLVSTAILVVTVSPPPSFTLSASPATLTLYPGSSSTTVITVNGKNGFTGGVSLVSSALPSGITVSFAPNPTTGTSVLTLTASSSATSENLVFPITGTSGSLTATANITVQMPYFLLAASPNSVTMGQGSSATTTVTVQDMSSFAGSVNLSVSGLLSGVTASFTPNPTTGTSQLTFNSSSTAAGFTILWIQGTCANQSVCGTLTAKTPFYLTVSPPSFTLVSPAPPISIAQGGSGTSTITVNPLYGFTGSVNLAATQLPKGVTASFTPNPTTGTSVVTITASSTSENGSFSVPITGTSGNVTASTYVPLTISLNPAATFTLAATPVTITGASGDSSQSTVTVAFPSGYAGDVTLTASGLPVDVAWQFSPVVVYGSGTSVLTLSVQGPVTLGTYNITVTGTCGTLTVNTSFVLTVVAPTFTLSSSVYSASIVQGASLQSTITVTPLTGFSGSVSLAASGLSSGLTASFSPNPTTGTSVLTLTASNSAAIASPTVIITGTDGTPTAITEIYITIVAASPGFSLGAAPSSLTIAQGASGTSTISVTDQGGFTGSASLAASGLPGGVTASFTPNPTTGTSALTLTASSSVATGTYNLTVTGTSGTLTATTNVVLTIIAPGFSPPGANFGAVNIGAESPVQTLTYTFGAAVTLGSTAMLTQGATGQDFADAGSDTCTANTAYAAYQSCTVNVTFTPRFAGTRYGAVVLYDNNGNLIATAYLQGTGVGPQLRFLPGSQSTLDITGFPSSVAIDGSGDIYFADMDGGAVYELQAVNGSIPASPTLTQLGSGFMAPLGMAVDGEGNVYVADIGKNAVKEILAVNGGIPALPTIVTLGSGFNNPDGVAVDGSGNVYVADYGNNAVKEILAVNGAIPASPTIVTLGSGFNNPGGVAVDSSGNVYVSDLGNKAVKEILAVNGSIPASPVINTLSSGFNSPYGIAVDGGGNVYVADMENSAVKEILAVNGSIPASPVIASLGAGFSYLTGVAVDGSGNVYAADYALVKLDLVDAPSLSFASTAVGSTSADSPQTVTVENIGNAALTFPIPASGNNPGIAANFTLNSSGTSACPLVSSGSSTAGTLAADASCQLPISFAPAAAGALNGSLALTDNNLNAAAPGYAVQSIALSGTGTQATPTITWPTPAPITYGTPLSATQLDASSTVAGTFTYSPAAGTVLTAGSQTLSVTFAPTDSTDYTAATATVTITVNQATPTITWPSPAPITYGTALSTTQLNASSTVAGTFTYSPAAGTALTAGSQTLSVTLAPTDTTDYTAATATVTLTVNQATPAITWATPAAITYGTALSATQLNASSTVAGTFTYSPAAGTVLGAGSQTLSVTLAPTDSTDYTTATASVTLTVNKATPVITWPTPAAITYGTALSATQLDASSTVAGSFTYSPAAGTVLGAGQQTLTATFAPTDTTDYAAASATVTLTVNQATPTITWATPAAITYGAALSGTQLNASSTVAGTFTYSPAFGTVLGAGQQTLTATFAPTDTADYTTAAATVTLTVSKATPAIVWATPAAITYGTALSATQLDASSTVAGSFTYSPAAGTVLGAGSQTLTVSFAPTDSTDYTTATASVTLTVNKATPAITWPTPAAITYGTALSATQLDASSTVAGTFTYSPAAGTVLGAGSQTLTVSFAPTDTTDYTTASDSVTLTVNKAVLTITWATPASITYGTALSGTQLDASSTVAGTFTYSPAAGTVLGAGSQTLTVTLAPTDSTDYTTATASVTLTVNKATSAITWPTPAAITYGTALSGTQLNASSTVAGTLTYSPAAGTVLNAGTQTLTVSFVPTDTTDYTTASDSVTLTVNKAVLTITWATPASITYGTALSGTQLDASSTAAGTFAYSPAAGTVLAVGSHTLTVTLTPTTPANYTTATATATVTLTVNKATPTITWATPAAITYGTALSSTQLDATSSVAGTFTYSPAAKTVLNTGAQTLSVTFAPTNTTDYTSATASVTLTVNKATPAITWATPAAITYGTALNATQLDATSIVAGTFTYSPAAGTVLTAGSQTLSVAFAPTNTTDYTAAADSVTLTVNKATPTVKLTASASSVTSGTSVTFTATLTGSGVKPTGTVTFLDGTTKLGAGTLNGSGVATFATSTLAVGKQSITASYGGDGNYLTATSTAITVTVTAK
jgi:sugar lactone lactonase YvrE